MSDDILMENTLNHIRKSAIKKVDNRECFRISLEEDYSQKIGQEVVLLMGRAPKCIIEGEKYITYSIKLKIGDSVINIAPHLSEEEINLIFNLPYKESNG